MGLFKEIFTDYATKNYPSMPKIVQNIMLDEGKKKLEKDHPIISTFMSEKTKERCVESYFLNQYTKDKFKHL